MEDFPAKNPNPVLCIANDGTVLYSNKACEPLLHEWRVAVGEQVPSTIRNLVQRVFTLNIPEKLEVKARNRMYLLAFHPSFENECVNIYGFDISDQKRLEEKLRESEEKYRNIVEIANEGILIINDEPIITYVNKKMAEMLECSRDEIIGKSVTDFTNEDGKNIFEQNMKKRRQGIDEIHEFRFICKDGSSLWTLVNSKSLFDKNGKFIGSISMLTDITKRKEVESKLKKTLDSLEYVVKERTVELEKANKSLKENEKVLVDAQKMAHIGNWEWDIATDKAYWSDEMYRIFRRSPQESAPTYIQFLNYVHPDDRSYIGDDSTKSTNENLSGIDIRIVLDNGEERTIHMQSEIILDEKNIPIRLKGIIQDITERKRDEEKLRESEEKYRNIVETANEGIAVLDSEGKHTYVNKKLADMLGYSEKELYGKFVEDLAEDASVFKVKFEKRRRGDSESYEIKLIRKDGTPLWVLVNAKALLDTNGRFIGSLSMITDINPKKEAEKALAEIEIARKKEIHHRIKNNLQVISSLLDLQAEKFKNRKNVTDLEVLEAFNESQGRVISMAFIHEELHRAGEINTLNFSQYIKELIDNLFLTYRLGNTGVRLDKDIEKDIFFDMDTAVPLGIIINELVSNSLKYAFPDKNDGEIRIKLHREEGSNTSFILSISDNGVGIPESINIEDLDSLGLQLVTSLVDQLDGEIELKRNKGTEFTVKFTVAEKDNQV